MHILLIEHNPERVRTIEGALTPAGHRVESVGSGGAALAALTRPGAPDLVLTQDHLPDMSAPEFLRAAERMTVRVAVIVLGADAGVADWIECTRLGVADYVTADADGAWLTTLAARVEGARERRAGEDRFRRLSDALDSTSAAVLIADQAGRCEYANPACARLLARATPGLRGLGLTDIVSLDDAPRKRADLFAAMDVGGEWAGELEVRRPDDERVPCVVTLSPVRRAGGGIDGFVLTLRDVSDRIAVEEALRAANRRLAEQAARDPLTGLYNRAYFREVLDREGARSVRYGDELSVLMADLDEFKRVNDASGHEVGDGVLQDISAVLPRGLREGDVVSRYGGDEFCVLLPNTGCADGRAVAERVRRSVEEHDAEREVGLGITVSIGLATSPDPEGKAVPPAELLRRADQALLEGKRRGANRVIVWRDYQ